MSIPKIETDELKSLMEFMDTKRAEDSLPATAVLLEESPGLVQLATAIAQHHADRVGDDPLANFTLIFKALCDLLNFIEAYKELEVKRLLEE